MKNFSTPKFAVTRRALLRDVWLTGAGRYLTVVLTPVAAAVVAGICLDERWHIVALMYIFICLPTMLMIVYFSKMLRPEMFVNTMPHTLRVEGRDIYICADVVPYPEPDEEATVPDGSPSGKEATVPDGSPSGKEATVPDGSPSGNAVSRQIDYRFRLREQKPLVMSTDSLLLMLDAPHKGFIAVPNQFLPENDPK